MVQVAYKEETAPELSVNQPGGDVAETAAKPNGEGIESSAPDSATTPAKAEPVHTEGEKAVQSSALQFHSIAAIFPLMQGAEFKALVADIKVNRLREPITTYQGKILDGRHRYRACLEADATPRFERYTGNDPISFVLSKNVRRRHLTVSQRAMVGAKLATLPQGRPGKTGQSAGFKQEEAARLLNVSVKAIRRAAEVIRQGVPELQQAVVQGTVSVSAATAIAKSKPDQQQEILKINPKRMKKHVKKMQVRRAGAKRRKAREIARKSAVSDAELPETAPGQDDPEAAERHALTRQSDHDEEVFQQLTEVWGRAGEQVRRRFRAEVLGMEPAQS